MVRILEPFFEKIILSSRILLASFFSFEISDLRGKLTFDMELLNDFTFSQDDAFQYLNMINFRLVKLLELHNLGESNLDLAVNNIKPPIFWKERPIMLQHAKKWQKQALKEALLYIGHTEEMIKKNSYLNSATLLKNSITNLCAKTWSYF